MDHFFQQLASELIFSIRCLEKGKQNSSTQEREKALQCILKVSEMKMDLNKKIIEGIFFSVLNLLTDQPIIESELLLLVKVLNALFDKYSAKSYFLEKTQDNNNLMALLIKISLPNLHSSIKELAHLTATLLIQIVKSTEAKALKNFYPTLCSEFLKLIINPEPSIPKKVLLSSIEFLICSFGKLFTDSVYKNEKENDIVNRLNGITNQIKSINTKATIEAPKSDKQEEAFYSDAKKMFGSFWSVLAENGYRIQKSQELSAKFIELFEFILNKCGKFFQVQVGENFIRIFEAFIQFLNFDDSKISNFTNYFKNNSHLNYQVKSLQIKYLKQTSKLLNEVEANYFTHHFNKINAISAILKNQSFVTYTPSETTTVIQTFQKIFQFNHKGQIIVNDHSIKLESFRDVKLSTDYNKQITQETHKAFSHFIVEYLPVTNFMEEAYQSIETMFSLINGGLALAISNFSYQALVEKKFRNFEEVLTNLLILSLILENSPEVELPTSQILEYFLADPLHAMPRSETYKGKEQTIFLELLSIKIVFYSYQRLKVKSHILTSRILIYLFGKFHKETDLQRLLIWNYLVKISRESFAQCETFQDVMKFYSETLIRNFIDKLAIINILSDHQLPFQILRTFIWFLDQGAFLKYAENFITHLNKHFDRFYLQEDFKTTSLIFPLYKLMLEAISSAFSANKQDAKLIIVNSNTIRSILMRTKPFILEKDLNFSYYALEIFRISCLPLSCLPMEREEAKSNFSPDDPENVSIPESLGPLAWEIFGLIAHRMKVKTNPSIMLECLQCLQEIQKYNQTFLVNERRFENLIFPVIQDFFSKFNKETLNRVEIKILDTFWSIISKLALQNIPSNKAFINQITAFSQESLGLLGKNPSDETIENVKNSINSCIIPQ